MHTDYFTLQGSVVQQEARNALAAVLDWSPYKRSVSVRALLDLLLLMATLKRSLFAIVRRFRFGFSHETARKAVLDNLPSTEVLTEGLVHALQAIAIRRRSKGRFILAIDAHYVCFYGKRSTKGIVGGKKKQGTKYFYGYATAVLIRRRHRYTLGVIALEKSTKPYQMVQQLVQQARKSGLRLRGVVLDRGFDCGQTLLYLQQQGLAYVVPLCRKGKQNSRRNQCFSHPDGTVLVVDWKVDRTRELVRTEALVKMTDGETRLYAFGGWSVGAAESALRRARFIDQIYSRRFGIETSYRQMNESKAQTTSKDVAYRLLLIGVALLLRQVWVSLTAQIAAVRRLPQKQWVDDLPLTHMTGWIADLLKEEYKLRDYIRLRIRKPGEKV